MKRNRRELLKLLGATGVSGAAITGIPGAAASSSNSIPASTSGYINDSDWEVFREYHVQEEYDGASSNAISTNGYNIPDDLVIPNPVGFEFDVCAQLPDGKQICVKSFEEGIVKYHDCAGRDLFTFGLDIAKESISVTGEITIEWKTKVWIGIDSDGCIWVGVNSAGQEECSRQYCPPEPIASVADQKEETSDTGVEIVDKIRANEGDILVVGGAAAVALGGIAGAAAGGIALDPT